MEPEQQKPTPEPSQDNKPAMAGPSDNLILGLEQSDYVKYCYWLILGSSALGILSSFMSMLGLHMPLNLLVSLANLIGLVMGLLGYFAFKEEMNPLNRSHMGYVAMLIGIFIVGSIIIMGSMGQVFDGGFFMYLVSTLISCAALFLFYAGYTLWQGQIEATKSSVKDRVNALIEQGKAKIQNIKD